MADRAAAGVWPGTEIQTAERIRGVQHGSTGLGKSLLENLSTAATTGAGQRITGESRLPWQIETDRETGQSSLKIPMPSADLLGQANVWLLALAGALGKNASGAKAD